MDVTALYSNIPIKEGIQTALDLVEEHQDDVDTIGFELDELENLLRFVLKNNCFRFRKDFYRQKNGRSNGQRTSTTIHHTVHAQPGDKIPSYNQQISSALGEVYRYFQTVVA